MNDDRYRELSDTERDAMRSMAPGPAPRAGLEDDTVRVLASHGLIRSRKRGILMKLSLAVGTLVAAGLVFIAGVTVGQRDDGDVATVAPKGEKQYMLLLFMTAGEKMTTAEPPKSDALLAIIEEYRQWGQRLSEEGRLVGAEKLKGDAFVLHGDHAKRLDHRPAGERVLGGYFLIQAPSIERARKIASTHPHLKYGGEIEVRPLDLQDES